MTNCPPPTLNSPTNGATGISTNPTFSWSSVTGATAGYYLAIATSSSALPTLPTATACSGCVYMVPASGTSITPSTTLVAGTRYYWKVRGRGPGSIYGDWSSPFSFTTITAHAPTLTLTSTSGPSVPAGQPYSITVRAADVDGNLSNVDVNWNDGTAVEHKTVSGSSQSVTFTRTFSTPRQINWSANAYDTTLLASNQLSGTFNVTANAPTLTLTSTSGTSVPAGQPYSITVRAADVNGNLSNVDVNWNDGTPVE